MSIEDFIGMPAQPVVAWRLLSCTTIAGPGVPFFLKSLQQILPLSALASRETPAANTVISAVKKQHFLEHMFQLLVSKWPVRELLYKNRAFVVNTSLDKPCR